MPAGHIRAPNRPCPRPLALSAARSGAGGTLGPGRAARRAPPRARPIESDPAPVAPLLAQDVTATKGNTFEDYFLKR